MAMIIKHKKILTDIWIPTADFIEDRENEMKEISTRIYEGYDNNIICYGKPGTGKTLLNKVLAEKNRGEYDIVYVNCRDLTDFKAIRFIAAQLDINYRGQFIDTYYRMIESKIKNEKKKFILILDEIDKLLKKSGDSILYQFSRMDILYHDKVVDENFEQPSLSLILISNDTLVEDKFISPPVKSSLGLLHLFFPSYNAETIKKIFDKRIPIAFHDKVFEPGVVEKMAALSALEHGDARQALSLLKEAGELAEQSSSLTIKMEHIDIALDKIETDRAYEQIKSLPGHYQVLVLSIIKLKSLGQINTTGKVYEKYNSLCCNYRMKPLTQRMIYNYIAYLEDLGLVNTAGTNNCRTAGNSRMIDLTFFDETMKKVEKYIEEANE